MDSCKKNLPFSDSISRPTAITGFSHFVERTDGGENRPGYRPENVSDETDSSTEESSQSDFSDEISRIEDLDTSNLIPLPPDADDETCSAYKRLNESLSHINATMKTVGKAISDVTFPHLDTMRELSSSGSDKLRREIGKSVTSKKLCPTLVACINLLTYNGTTLPVEINHQICVDHLLTLCWNYSDADPAFGEELCRQGVVSLLIRMLIFSQKNPVEKQTSQEIISILHNCARHGENIIFYQNIETINAIGWVAKNGSKSIEFPNALVAAMTLAHIIEDKNNDVVQADDVIINLILEMLRSALKSMERRYIGFHTSELVAGLSRLANNQYNSIVLVQNGFLQELQMILESDHIDEKEHAAGALWNLSFTKENRPTILRNEKIITSLKTIAESTEILKLKQNAKGALWELMKEQGDTGISRELTHMCELNRNVQIKGFAATSSRLTGRHVMISYNWGRQELMIKLKEKLETVGYRTWMDIDRMRGDMLEAMADAVQNSAVMLVAMTSAYKESKSCRSEATYAHQLNIPIVPITVEKSYHADGWLGLIIGAKLYYDVTDEKALKKSFPEILKAINPYYNEKNETKDDDVAVKEEPKKMEHCKSLKLWSTQDVLHWLKENNFNILRSKLSNPKQLRFLKKIKKESPDFYYSHVIMNQLGLKTMEDVMDFTEAVENLPED